MKFFTTHFGAPDVASVVYWGGLYKIHCHMVKVCLPAEACSRQSSSDGINRMLMSDEMGASLRLRSR